MANQETNQAIDAIGFALFTFLAIPFAIVPAAFAMAFFSYVTGIEIAAWAATVAAIPLAIRIARAAMAIL